MIIKSLPKSEYEDYPLVMDYTSDYYYEVELHNGISVNNFFITKHKFKETFKKVDLIDTLYSPHFENAEAFGAFINNELIGVVEVNAENYNNRLRITELWVDERYRKQNIASSLLDYVKQIALGEFRAIVLETQSCNYSAINLYMKNEFKLIGLDTLHYSNNDIENREVRLEFGYIFN